MRCGGVGVGDVGASKYDGAYRAEVAGRDEACLGDADEITIGGRPAGAVEAAIERKTVDSGNLGDARNLAQTRFNGGDELLRVGA